jgi:hypothetical protein
MVKPRIELPLRTSRIILENLQNENAVLEKQLVAAPYFISRCQQCKIDLRAVTASNVFMDRCNDTGLSIGRVICSVELLNCTNGAISVEYDQELSLTFDNCKDILVNLDEMKKCQWIIFSTGSANLKLQFGGVIHKLEDSIVQAESVRLILKNTWTNGQVLTTPCSQYGIEHAAVDTDC